MKRILLVLGIAVAVAAGANTTSNKVVFVDELGRNNAPEVIANLAQQTTNETMVLVAAAKAAAASDAATEATNAVADVVAAIVENEVRIFRKGYLSSFAPLISFSEDDVLTICDFIIDKENDEITIGYVCTADLGTVKPTVRATSPLCATDDFGEMADSDVSDVTLHDETRTFQGQTYSRWYSVTIPKPDDAEYYYFIEMNSDTPQGSGFTLDIKNGISGGYTGVLADGSLRKIYRGGILVDCQTIE